MEPNEQKNKILEVWRNGIDTSAGQAEVFSLKPRESDLSAYEAALRRHAGKEVLILGSTPSLRDLAARHKKNVTIADANSLMMISTSALLKEANPNHEKWLHTEWLRMSLPQQSYDIVMGDIMWWFFSPREQEVLRNIIAGCLRPGGFFISRFYIRHPQENDDPSAILERYVEKATQTPDRLTEIYHAAFLHLTDRLSDSKSMKMKRVAVEDVISRYKNLSPTDAKLLSIRAKQWIRWPNYTLQSRDQIVSFFQNKFTLLNESYAEDYCGSESLPVMTWQRHDNESSKSSVPAPPKISGSRPHPHRGFFARFKKRPVKKFSFSKLNEITDHFGSPLFIVFEGRIRAQYRNFRRALNEHYPNSAIAYSIKTNPLKKICSLLKRGGALAEVVSGSEYLLAKKTGFAGKRIIFNGLLKKEEELRKALADDAVIIIDSQEEFFTLCRIAETIRKRISIGIRVSSTEMAAKLTKDKKESMPDRFGFTLENGEAASFCRAVAGAGSQIVICGYHMHMETNITEPSVYAEATRLVCSFAALMYKQFGFTPEFIDMGGGFPNFYTKSAIPIPAIDEFIKAIASEIKKADLPIEPKLFLEPGRYIVAGSTVFVASVISVKWRDGKQLVTIDASAGMLPSAPRQHHPISEFISNPRYEKSGEKIDTIVAGASCMGIDTWGTYGLPLLNENDLLIAANCGAYSISVSNQFIFPRPAVIWVDTESNISLARRGETAEDLTRLDT